MSDPAPETGRDLTPYRVQVLESLRDYLGDGGPSGPLSATQAALRWLAGVLPTPEEVLAVIDDHVAASRTADGDLDLPGHEGYPIAGRATTAASWRERDPEAWS